MRKQSINSSEKNSSLITVDSFANGVALGKVKQLECESNQILPLSLEMEDQTAMLKSRYSNQDDFSISALEGRLSLLQRKGELERSTLIFGVDADPFHPFESRFDASMKFLALFEKYSAGQIIIQTRSPLLVIAMPILRRLSKRLMVSIPVETSSPEVASKYTPHLPKISERLRVATVLRRFGIKVHLQVAPLLPYGDMKRDAAAFASMLIANGDFISIKPLLSETVGKSRKTQPSVINRLAAERNFLWLRPDAHKYLLQSVSLLAEDKLRLPELTVATAKQLSIFAA